MQKVKKIILCEHDGVFFGGIPRNVVMMVTFFNGSEIRVPYAADKPISALYEDLNAIAPEEGSPIEVLSTGEVKSEKHVSSAPLAKAIATAKVIHDTIDKSYTIEKEDIVKLIMLDPGRNKDQTCLLVVGQELRVITIRKSNNIVTSYEVVDDLCPRPERTTVYPQEVVLLRKRTPKEAILELKIEEIIPCPHCNVPNPLFLDGSEFKGICSECKQDIVVARIIKKCQTSTCAKDSQEVSCLDVGGKYEGQCNKCGVIVEVPYA